MEQLLDCSTWEDKIMRDHNPKTQHFMLTYDELVQRPFNTIGVKRDRPLLVFYSPDGVDQHDLGA